MPTPKGVRPGGRKKGTPNKVTQMARDIAAEEGVDPIRGLCRIAKNTKLPIDIRQRAYAEVARYTYPRLNSIDVGGAGGGPVTTCLELIVRDGNNGERLN
jgi:hypothetical protein